MVRRSTRRRGLFGTIYSPVSHLLQATGNAVGAVTNTTRNVVRRGLKGVNSVGKGVTGHANSAVRNVFSRKGRKSRLAGGKRKSRRANRKNRRNTRRNRK